MSSVYKVIFFDLDGTLIDPKEGITKSIQFALGKMGFPAPSSDELTWCIGPSLRESFSQLMHSSCKEKVASALNHYRERYTQKGMYEHVVYPGIEEMLGNFYQEGYRLFVATAKPEVFAVDILNHFGLAHYFEKIYGAQLDGTHTNKGELLKFAIEKSVVKEPSLMVGDRQFDMIAALQNGLAALGVTYGYGSEEELLQAGAMHLCCQPREIYDWVVS